LKKVETQPLSLETRYWQGISARAKSFLLKMLDKNPETRLSAQEALDDVWVRLHTQREEVIQLLDLVSNFISVHFQGAQDMILNLHAVKTDNSVKTSPPSNV
jgi:serine/threonine protein kinase